MSGIVLSSSVRQNLLSLQSTADLLATTQNRLATGKKVNTALDNPTNFFTAQSLDGRASDISNLLDGIGNGVQVLQAANTGITSLQKLVDTAKSIANQALQTTVGYSTKSNVSATIAGATATDLRGTTTFTSATATSNVISDGTAGGTHCDHRRDHARRHQRASLVGTAPRRAGDGAAGPHQRHHPDRGHRHQRNRPAAATPQPTDGQTLTVNGKTITFKAGSAPAAARFPPDPASSATSSPTVRQLHRLSRHHRHPDWRPSATSPRRSTSPAASRRPSITAGVAAISNSSGTNGTVAAGMLTLYDRHRR